MKFRTQPNSDTPSIRKLVIIAVCVGLCTALVEALSSEPFWFGVALWIGFLLGYWVPPIERSISIRRYALFTLLVSLLGSLALKAYRSL